MNHLAFTPNSGKHQFVQVIGIIGYNVILSHIARSHSMATSYFIAKAGFFTLLTVLHLALFGIPAIRSYIAGQVTVVETTDHGSPVLAPAITLCPPANHTRGWTTYNKEQLVC